MMQLNDIKASYFYVDCNCAQKLKYESFVNELDIVCHNTFSFIEKGIKSPNNLTDGHCKVQRQQADSLAKSPNTLEVLQGVQ